MWFGTNKNDSSLSCVIEFYWKSQAPAVLAKLFVIDYQELLVKQNAPRGKLKNPWTVRTPQGIFTDEYGAVGEKKKCLLPMTAPFLSIDGKPLALFDTTCMRTLGNHKSVSTDAETLQSRGWNQICGIRSKKLSHAQVNINDHPTGKASTWVRHKQREELASNKHAPPS